MVTEDKTFTINNITEWQKNIFSYCQQVLCNFVNKYINKKIHHEFIRYHIKTGI